MVVESLLDRGAFWLEHSSGGIGHRLGVERRRLADLHGRPFYERHGYACVATLANDRFGKALFIMEKHLRKP